MLHINRNLINQLFNDSILYLPYLKCFKLGNTSQSSVVDWDSDTCCSVMTRIPEDSTKWVTAIFSKYMPYLISFSSLHENLSHLFVNDISEAIHSFKAKYEAFFFSWENGPWNNDNLITVKKSSSTPDNLERYTSQWKIPVCRQSIYSSCRSFPRTSKYTWSSLVNVNESHSLKWQWNLHAYSGKANLILKKMRKV